MNGGTDEQVFCIHLREISHLHAWCCETQVVEAQELLGSDVPGSACTASSYILCTPETMLPRVSVDALNSTTARTLNQCKNLGRTRSHVRLNKLPDEVASWSAAKYAAWDILAKLERVQRSIEDDSLSRILSEFWPIKTEP